MTHSQSALGVPILSSYQAITHYLVPEIPVIKFFVAAAQDPGTIAGHDTSISTAPALLHKSTPRKMHTHQTCRAGNLPACNWSVCVRCYRLNNLGRNVGPRQSLRYSRSYTFTYSISRNHHFCKGRIMTASVLWLNHVLSCETLRLCIPSHHFRTHCTTLIVSTEPEPEPEPEHPASWIFNSLFVHSNLK